MSRQATFEGLLAGTARCAIRNLQFGAPGGRALPVQIKFDATLEEKLQNLPGPVAAVSDRRSLVMKDSVVGDRRYSAALRWFWDMHLTPPRRFA